MLKVNVSWRDVDKRAFTDDGMVKPDGSADRFGPLRIAVPEELADILDCWGTAPRGLLPRLHSLGETECDDASVARLLTGEAQHPDRDAVRHVASDIRFARPHVHSMQKIWGILARQMCLWAKHCEGALAHSTCLDHFLLISSQLLVLHEARFENSKVQASWRQNEFCQNIIGSVTDPWGVKVHCDTGSIRRLLLLQLHCLHLFMSTSLQVDSPDHRLGASSWTIGSEELADLLSNVHWPDRSSPDVEED